MINRSNILLVIVVGVAGYFIWRNFQSPAVTPSSTTASNTGGSQQIVSQNIAHDVLSLINNVFTLANKPVQQTAPKTLTA